MVKTVQLINTIYNSYPFGKLFGSCLFFFFYGWVLMGFACCAAPGDGAVLSHNSKPSVHMLWTIFGASVITNIVLSLSLSTQAPLRLL